MALDNQTFSNREALAAQLQSIENELAGNLETIDVTTTNLTVNGNLYVAPTGEIDFDTKSFATGQVVLKEDFNVQVGGIIKSETNGALIQLNDTAAEDGATYVKSGDTYLSIIPGLGGYVTLTNGTGDVMQAILVGSSDTEVVGTLRLSTIQTFANNAAAITGGLTTSQIYQTATGELRIVV